MAYANKYKITYATKSGKFAYLYLQEDGYVGDVIEYEGINLQYQYIPQSDDPFEVVYASQLSVTIDITDDLVNMPNFTSLNDRKYYTELYLDSDLQFFGYSISDSVQVSFNTGRRYLSFNAIDGIGMLQSIKFPVAAATNINDLETLLYYLTTALNTLNLPINPNLVTMCSIYADGMLDRADGTENEPFAQSYLPYRTFLETPQSYVSCYEVIVRICKSFGCKWFIANGKWYIANINEMASDSIYYTEYDYLMNVVSSGIMETLSVIEGYTGNTSNVYFINASQNKILRKGYSKITSNVEISTCPNYLSNGNLRPVVGSFPANWSAGQTTGASWSLVSQPDNTSDKFVLYRNPTVGTYAYVESGSNPKINAGDIINLSWTYYSQDQTGYRGLATVYIQNGSLFYYYVDSTKSWVDYAGGGSIYVPEYGNSTSGNEINSFSFSTTPAPISGIVWFELRLEDGTCQNIQVGDFNMTIDYSNKSISYSASISSEDQYVNNIEIPFGSYTPSNSYPSEFGVILNDGYGAWLNWYVYGKAPTYDSLLSLLTQQYINVFGKNIINIDCSLSSFDTDNGLINGIKIFKADDIDPPQINVSENWYMLGNSTINYPTDETSCTLLQINGDNIDATLEYKLNYNKG